MQPTTLRAAIEGGATVILRGHGRAYAPGDTAFRFCAVENRPSKFDPPGARGWLRFVPVTWRDDGWRAATLFPQPFACLQETELVTVVE